MIYRAIKYGWHATAGMLLVALLISCEKPKEQAYEFAIPAGLESLQVNVPSDNPMTHARVELGQKLYFDERLSVDATVSCATCHVPTLSFTDGRVTSVGVYGLTAGRNAPTLINRVFGQEQFLDGRAGSIEEAVLMHIRNENEMRTTPERVAQILNQDQAYRQEFQQAFGTEATPDAIARALAAFVRTFLSGNSDYDRYVAGEQDALSESARRGLALFRSDRLRCSTCHAGPNFSDEQYRSNGAGMDAFEPDAGRFLVTGDSSDFGKFKTPTLRDIARTAPYMHDGSVRTLREVVRFYNRGGIEHSNRSPLVKPLNLTDAEIEDVVNFLRSLQGSNMLFFSSNTP